MHFVFCFFFLWQAKKSLALLHTHSTHSPLGMYSSSLEAFRASSGCEAAPAIAAIELKDRLGKGKKTLLLDVRFVDTAVTNCCCVLVRRFFSPVFFFEFFLFFWTLSTPALFFRPADQSSVSIIPTAVVCKPGPEMTTSEPIQSFIQQNFDLQSAHNVFPLCFCFFYKETLTNFIVSWDRRTIEGRRGCDDRGVLRHGY